MIRSFRDNATEVLFRRRKHRDFVNITAVALRKLDQLDAALTVFELNKPPANRLELLKGNRAGQYSIRINQQYRLCFEWAEKHPENVEIVDYH